MRRTVAALAGMCAALLLLGTPLPAVATGSHRPGRPVLERLDRGLVAAVTTDGVFLS